MARPLRIQVPGLSYHITARGNGRMAIYLDDVDRRRFLALLGDVLESFRVDCHAYCLMPNHYHLVITTQDANLSRALKHLNGNYAQWWNHRHGRVGHVTQGRFAAQVVQDGDYLLTACCYTVLNPVRAHLVQTAADWPWSSYRATAGLTSCPEFLRPTVIWDMVAGSDTENGPRRYRELVAERQTKAGAHPMDPVLGDAVFLDRFRTLRERASREVPLRERRSRPSLEALFAGAISRERRHTRIVDAHDSGYSMAEIAQYLNVHPCTIWRAIASERHAQIVQNA